MTGKLWPRSGPWASAADAAGPGPRLHKGAPRPRWGLASSGPIPSAVSGRLAPSGPFWPLRVPASAGAPAPAGVPVGPPPPPGLRPPGPGSAPLAALAGAGPPLLPPRSPARPCSPGPLPLLPAALAGPVCPGLAVAALRPSVGRPCFVSGAAFGQRVAPRGVRCGPPSGLRARRLPAGPPGGLSAAFFPSGGPALGFCAARPAGPCCASPGVRCSAGVLPCAPRPPPPLGAPGARCPMGLRPAFGGPPRVSRVPHLSALPARAALAPVGPFRPGSLSGNCQPWSPPAARAIIIDPSRLPFCAPAFRFSESQERP